MPRRGVTLTSAAREFFRHPSPWLLAAALIAALIARIALGDFRLSDAVLPLVMRAGFPFLEWMMHVIVLHWRPRRVAGITIDPVLDRIHREHHVEPRVIPLIFIPMQSLYGAVGSALIIGLWIFPRTALGLTFLVVTFAIGLVYEWT
ncbi:MAG: sterol desaturase family protein, partial [Mycobacterium sp.]